MSSQSCITRKAANEVSKAEVLECRFPLTDEICYMPCVYSITCIFHSLIGWIIIFLVFSQDFKIIDCTVSFALLPVVTVRTIDYWCTKVFCQPNTSFAKQETTSVNSGNLPTFILSSEQFLVCCTSKCHNLWVLGKGGNWCTYQGDSCRLHVICRWNSKKYGLTFPHNRNFRKFNFPAQTSTYWHLLYKIYISSSASPDTTNWFHKYLTI